MGQKEAWVEKKCTERYESPKQCWQQPVPFRDEPVAGDEPDRGVRFIYEIDYSQLCKDCKAEIKNKIII